MKNSAWVVTFTGLMLTAGLAAAAYAAVNVHPVHRLEYLTRVVNCETVEGQPSAIAAEAQHVRQYSVCLDRSTPVESARSVTQCSSDNCGTESAQERKPPQIVSATFQR
jgi:hypothetical protein